MVVLKAKRLKGRGFGAANGVGMLDVIQRGDLGRSGTDERNSVF